MVNNSINVLKAFLVLLVLLGHAIQFSYENHGLKFDDDNLFRLIYAFHMPLFISVSGYLYKMGRPENIRKYLKLTLVPFFAWGFIEYLFFYAGNEGVFGYLIKISINPDLGLWFLLALLQAVFIVELVGKYIRSENQIYYFIGIYAVLGGFSYTTGIKAVGINLLVWMGPFFVMGMYIKKYSENLNLKNDRTMFFLVFLAGMFLLMPYWRRTSSDVKSVGIYVEYLIIKYVVAIFCCLCVYINLNMLNFKNKLLEFIARNSLAFYAIQFPIFKITFFFNGQMEYIALFFLVGGTSLIAIYIINKYRYVREILFGR